MFLTDQWIFVVRRDAILRLPAAPLSEGVEIVKTDFPQWLPIRPDHHPDFHCGNMYALCAPALAANGRSAALIRGSKWLAVDLLSASLVVRMHTLEMPVRGTCTG